MFYLWVGMVLSYCKVGLYLGWIGVGVLVLWVLSGLVIIVMGIMLSEEWGVFDMSVFCFLMWIWFVIGFVMICFFCYGCFGKLGLYCELNCILLIMFMFYFLR